MALREGRARDAPDLRGSASEAPPVPARLTFETMGTVVDLVGTAGFDEAAARSVQAAFDALDARFSLYRPDSEASWVGADRARARHASADYRDMYAAALAWSEATGRAFTPHRPDGVIDLSGIVKARAVRDAGDALLARGVRDWCLNAGGDVLVSGAQRSGGPWVAGIVDPLDRARLWSQVELGTHRAVATSGTAERGEHVWRLAADDTFDQVTVVADDIETADVLATAILAGGVGTLELAQRSYDVDVLASARDGRVWASPALLA